MKRLKKLLIQFLIGLASFAVTMAVMFLISIGIQKIVQRAHPTLSSPDISFEVKGCEVESTTEPPLSVDDTADTSQDQSSDTSQDQTTEGLNLLPLGSVLYPEDYSDTHPYVVNTGNMKIYVFMEFSQRAFAGSSTSTSYGSPDSTAYTLKDSWQSSHTPRPDGLIPTFHYSVNNSWTLVDEEYKDGILYSTYAFNLALEPGEASLPLFDYMQVTGFTWDTWRSMGATDVFTNIQTYALGETGGYNSMTPEERWAVAEKMK